MKSKISQTHMELFNRIGSVCICANLRKASRVVTKAYDEFLQPSGLLTTQFILLSAIGSQASIPLTPLADELGMDPTTLARNLKPLERDGWIQVLKGDDRRTRILKLTDAGLEVLLKACPLWEQAQAWGVSQIGEDRLNLMLGDWLKLGLIAQG